MFAAQLIFGMHDVEVVNEVNAAVVDNENPDEVVDENEMVVPPQANLQRARLFRDRLDPLQVPDVHLLRYYRLPRHLIIQLADILTPDLEHQTQRSHSLTVILQVLIGLRFLASGGFQSLIGDVAHVSQSTCSRVLARFCAAIVRRAPEYVRYPLEDAEFLTGVKDAFYAIAHIPNVIGAVDGTHVLLMPPRHDKPNYINRKGQSSLNVQAVCDAQLRIMNLVVQWPGSSHDSFIWANCALKRRLDEHICPGSYVIGDSGYPLEQYLLTPFRNPATAAQERYNQAHIRTRNPIERCFGNLKSRFRALHASGGVLMYTPEKVRNIIVTACVLHNICINEQLPLEQAEIIPLDEQPPQQNVRRRNRAIVMLGEHVRQQVVNRFQ